MSTAKKSPRNSLAHSTTQAFIENWARMIDTRPDGMSDHERYQIVTFLRRMARTPAAIEAMITTPKGRGNPSTRENRERTWKVALDYALAYERLGKADAALLEVRQAWKLGRTAVMDARKVSDRQGWKDWVRYERKQFELDHAGLSGAALLRAFSAELRKSG